MNPESTKPQATNRKDCKHEWETPVKDPRTCKKCGLKQRRVVVYEWENLND